MDIRNYFEKSQFCDCFNKVSTSIEINNTTSLELRVVENTTYYEYEK